MGCKKRFQSSLGRDVGITGTILISIADYSCPLTATRRQVARLPKARMPATGTMKPIVTAAMVSAARSA
jgi:hypothetical protein